MGHTKIDGRFFLFLAQFAVSMLILSFCCYKLRYLDTCDAQSLYGNIIITLMGLWMPSPIAMKSH